MLQKNTIKGRTRRRRKINIGVAVVCGLIMIAALIFGRYMLKEGNNSEAKEKTAHAKKELVINSKTQEAGESKEEKDGTKEGAPDRSDFAVQPGKIPGTSEQTAEKIVYLTLDDGPSQNTQAVLDILDQYHAKATFFVTGAMPEYKDMIKQAYDKGHTIGMHTYTHDYASVYASVDAYFQDLDAIGQLVKEQIGYVPCFIRFPGGSSNTVSANYTSGIMSALVQEVQNRGYQYYDWNASSGDGAVHNADELAAQATSFSENNIILLSHDSAAKQSTVEALPRIIEYYQSQGYTFKAMDRESYVAHHGVNN